MMSGKQSKKKKLLRDLIVGLLESKPCDENKGTSGKLSRLCFNLLVQPRPSWKR